MADPPKSATFETTVAATGNNTGIEVPPEVIEQLGAGKRPPVLVDVNGYQYRSTAAVMGGRHLIGISAAVRAATGPARGAAAPRGAGRAAPRSAWRSPSPTPRVGSTSPPTSRPRSPVRRAPRTSSRSC